MLVGGDPGGTEIELGRVGHPAHGDEDPRRLDPRATLQLSHDPGPSRRDTLDRRPGADVDSEAPVQGLGHFLPGEGLLA